MSRAEQQEKRLRGSSGRSQEIAQAAKETVDRRERLHDSFRAQLERELGPSDSAVRAALVESACSSHVQICEISAMFRHGRASERQLDRLATSRRQLRDALTALGLAAPAEPEPGAAGVSLDQAIAATENKGEVPSHAVEAVKDLN